MQLGEIRANGPQDGQTAEQQVRALYEYVLALKRQLDFVLSNLEDDNLSDDLQEDMKAGSQVEQVIRRFTNGDFESYFRQTAKSIEAKVEEDGVVAAINLSPEGLRIDSDRLNVNGVVSINGYFKVGADGKLYAVAGRIGGFEIGEKQLYTGENSASVVPTLYLGSEDLQKNFEVGGSGARKDWRLKVGSNFGVTADGTPYFTGGKILGAQLIEQGGGSSIDVGAKVKEITEGIAGLLELNRVKLNALTFGTAALELRDVTIDGVTYKVLAQASE